MCFFSTAVPSSASGIFVLGLNCGGGWDARNSPDVLWSTSRSVQWGSCIGDLLSSSSVCSGVLNGNISVGKMVRQWQLETWCAIRARGADNGGSSK